MTGRPRPCLECGTLTDSTRCPTHTARTRTQRGYDRAHTHARAVLAASLPTPCAYCGRTITTTADLVAAHVVDGHPEYGWQAAHPRCNERAKRRTA